MVEIHVDLYVTALVEKIAQQPVSGVLIEALQEAGADGHDALEVLDFEGKSSDDTVEFELVFGDVFGVLVFEVAAGAVQVFAVFVVFADAGLFECGFALDVGVENA